MFIVCAVGAFRSHIGADFLKPKHGVFAKLQPRRSA